MPVAKWVQLEPSHDQQKIKKWSQIIRVDDKLDLCCVRNLPSPWRQQLVGCVSWAVG